MAIRIELSKEMLKAAINTELGSLRRSKNTAKMPQFIPIIDKQITEYENALLSITDIKSDIK